MKNCMLTKHVLSIYIYIYFLRQRKERKWQLIADENSCCNAFFFHLIAVLAYDRPHNDTVRLLAGSIVYKIEALAMIGGRVCRYKIERLAVIGDVTDYWIPRNETPRRRAHESCWPLGPPFRISRLLVSGIDCSGGLGDSVVSFYPI